MSHMTVAKRRRHLLKGSLVLGAAPTAAPVLGRVTADDKLAPPPRPTRLPKLHLQPLDEAQVEAVAVDVVSR